MKQAFRSVNKDMYAMIPATETNAYIRELHTPFANFLRDITPHVIASTEWKRADVDVFKYFLPDHGLPSPLHIPQHTNKNKQDYDWYELVEHPSSGAGSGKEWLKKEKNNDEGDDEEEDLLPAKVHPSMTTPWTPVPVISAELTIFIKQDQFDPIIRLFQSSFLYWYTKADPKSVFYGCVTDIERSIEMTMRGNWNSYWNPGTSHTIILIHNIVSPEPRPFQPRTELATSNSYNAHINKHKNYDVTVSITCIVQSGNYSYYYTIENHFQFDVAPYKQKHMWDLALDLDTKTKIREQVTQLAMLPPAPASKAAGGGSKRGKRK